MEWIFIMWNISVILNLTNEKSCHNYVYVCVCVISTSLVPLGQMENFLSEFSYLHKIESV